MDSFIHFLLNPGVLLQQWVTILGTVAYIVIFVIIFAESGLLIGFFFPGDSLLFSAGFLSSAKIPESSQTYLNIWILIAIVFLGAVAGDSVGFTFGFRVGRKLFKRENSRFFNKENLIKAQKFYEKHGTKTIVLARFLPVIRTFAPIVAGIGKMNLKKFCLYTILGATMWNLFLAYCGYVLGKNWDVIKHYSEYISIIVASILVLAGVYFVDHRLRNKNRE
jgi:membrane-associated protein